MVIDPEEETVTADGERTTLEQTLGLRDTEAEQVMDSAQAAQDYFQDTPYEAEQTEQGTVIVTAPYQTKRLVVSPLYHLWGGGDAVRCPDRTALPPVRHPRGRPGGL